MPPSWLSLADEEEIEWSAHPSWFAHVTRVLLGVIVVAVGIGIAAGGLLGGVPLGSTTLGAAAGFVVITIGFALILYEYLRRTSRAYVLTTKHVYKKAGILRREVDPIRLDRVADMEYQQSAVQRVLGIGDVRIMTAGTGGKDMVLEAVPAVQEFTNRFAQAVDRQSESEVNRLAAGT